MKLTDNIFYVGVNDRTLDLFEGQYIIPNGVSYNSYVIMDDKIAIMDTVDIRAKDEWLQNLAQVLKNRSPDYLVVLHIEPDHAASIEAFLKKYPNTKIVSNAKVFNMLPQFFPKQNFSNNQVVAEGEELSLGSHTLKFFMAPMVHWPEVMMAYEKSEKILFSADAFGKFGTLDAQEDWDCEARRYYFNIVGRYGMQVQTVLKKLTGLDIQKIYPLHGPMLTEDLGHYLNKYDIWSSYRPEDEGIFIAYTSVYGHTKAVVEELKNILQSQSNVKVSMADLARDDMAEALEDAFRYDTLVLATTTYDGGIFPAMENFITHLIAKNYQNRRVGLIENGTWAPVAGKKMKVALENLKNLTFIEPMVTIKSSMNDENKVQLQALAQALLKKE